jgi:hypothetical protein
LRTLSVSGTNAGGGIGHDVERVTDNNFGSWKLLGKQMLEVGGIQRISVHDQVSDAAERPTDGVGQVASDLRHPRSIRRTRDSCNVYAPRLQVDDEEHQVAHESCPR